MFDKWVAHPLNVAVMILLCQVGARGEIEEILELLGHKLKNRETWRQKVVEEVNSSLKAELRALGCSSWNPAAKI